MGSPPDYLIPSSMFLSMKQKKLGKMSSECCAAASFSFPRGDMRRRGEPWWGRVFFTYLQYVLSYI